MRRWKLLLACAVLPMVLWLALPLGSSASPQGRLAQIQDKIEVTRWKIGRRKGVEKVLSSDIARWSARIGSLEHRIDRLRTREGELQADLDAKRAELVATQEKLRSERRRLARLRSRLAEGRRILERRLVELYQADKPDVVTVVLNSKGFADLLERGEFLRRIRNQDEQIIKIVRTAKADATATAKRLDRLERRQQQLTAIVLARRNQVAQAKMGLLSTQVGLRRTRQGKQRALSNVRAERHDLQENLEQMEAQSAKIASTLRAASAGPTLSAGPIKRGSGQLIWPVNGPITGSFGEARPGHMHAGIDIAAAEGTPIRAADSGKVVLLQGVGSSGGYGNFTCIAHSASMATCYAHQSRFGTSMGANVSQGQVIGYVGNTGHSFGAHLHFEVRINGAPVSPLAYL
ncbi:MAG: peptidoglycan DD-metalloendopeptidase family protein [Solirubrobacterales bacterium]|nr:peptidoglycan DD-metalloendopeptidase family protein [Solirubrobacterales bacterium]